MENFVFYNPTKILFGRGTIPAIGPESKLLGTKALLVYGLESIKKTGIHQTISTALNQHGVEYVEHPGVRSNPVLSHVREGIAKAKEHGVDLVIAAGGGSVLDSAKAICAGAVVEHDVWKFFTGKKGIKKCLPLATVLTLAAAGSEMNSGMVITNEETREKFGFGHQLLHPKVSILDPEATFTVPPDYTAYGAVDALAHVLEFYMTTELPSSPVQHRLMEGLMENSMDACNRCLIDPRDYAARSDLMWTATLALNGLTAAGLGRVGFPMHMIEHSLSALYDIPHGAGLSIVIPAWLTWFARMHPQRIAQLGERLFGLQGGDAGETALRTISGFKEWFEKVESPVTLGQVGIPAEDIPLIASNALKLAKIWRLNQYSQEIIEEILSLAH